MRARREGREQPDGPREPQQDLGDDVAARRDQSSIAAAAAGPAVSGKRDPRDAQQPQRRADEAESTPFALSCWRGRFGARGVGDP